MAKDEDLISGGMLDPYENQTAAIRDTTKWMVAAFAGIAAVLLASVKFSNISQLDNTHRVVAVVCVGLALLCVGGTIFYIVTKVLKPARLTLTTLQTDQELTKKVQNGGLLLLAEYKDGNSQATIAQLRQSYEQAVASLLVIRREFSDANDPSATLTQRLLDARSEYNRARQAIQETLSYASYLQTSERFTTALFVMAIVAAVTFVCLTTFTFTVAKTEKEEPLSRVEIQLPAGTYTPPSPLPPSGRTLQITSPMRVNVAFLTEDARKQFGQIYKCKAPREFYEAWAIGGDFDHPILVFPGGKECGPVRYTVTEILSCILENSRLRHGSPSIVRFACAAFSLSRPYRARILT